MNRSLLLLPLAFFLLGAGPPPGLAAAAWDDSNERFANDLLSQAADDRLYAARTLRSRLMRAIRHADHSTEGSLKNDEARATLDDFATLVAPACLESLQYENTAPICADILGELAWEPARAPLESLLLADPSGRMRRHGERAIARIAAAQQSP